MRRGWRVNKCIVYTSLGNAGIKLRRYGDLQKMQSARKGEIVDDAVNNKKTDKILHS